MPALAWGSCSQLSWLWEPPASPPHLAVQVTLWLLCPRSRSCSELAVSPAVWQMQAQTPRTAGSTRISAESCSFPPPSPSSSQKDISPGTAPQAGGGAGPGYGDMNLPSQVHRVLPAESRMRHLLLNLGKPGWSILPRGRAGKGRSSIVACDELPCQLPRGRGVPDHLHVCTGARRTWSEAICSWCSVASRCCAGSGAVPGDVSTPCLAATALQPAA